MDYWNEDLHTIRSLVHLSLVYLFLYLQKVATNEINEDNQMCVLKGRYK